MSTRTYLRSRVDPVALVGGLAIGDLVAIGIFVAVGQRQHGIDPLAFPAAYLEALGPFLLGWLLAAGLAGLYTRDAVLGPRRAVSWALPAWIVAAVIAQALRASSLVAGSLSPVFLLVSIGAGGVIVVSWRALVALLAEAV